MNINNLFNKTDIECTFSLESYIDSLNNDYDFNDYKIKVSNKTYDELSIESDRLYNEINNLITDYDKYSIEGILDKIKDLGKWIVEFIKKIILHLATIIKMIIAKIYELTIKSKESLYKKFNNKVFTELDIQINDRQLNPDIMQSIDDYIQFWELNIKDCDFQDGPKRYLENGNLNSLYRDLFENMHDSFIADPNDSNMDLTKISFNINNTINLLIDSMLYVSKEKRKTHLSLKEYFGCNVGETPKAIILLSDEYTKRLIQCKNNTELFLKRLKFYQKEIEKKNIELIKLSFEPNSDGSKEYIKKMKNVFSNITFFHNLNYTFFIKILQVRKKVAKYILKGIWGDKIVEQISAGIASGKPFKISTFYGIDFENFREFPNLSVDEERDGMQIIMGTDPNINFGTAYFKIEKSSKFYNKFLKFSLKADEINLIRSETEQSYSTQELKKRIESNNNILEELFSILKIPNDLKSFCTFGFNQNFQTNLNNRLMSEFKKKYNSDPDFIFFFWNSTHFTRKIYDQTLFHTSLNTIPNNFLQGFHRGAYFYSEKRCYFGLNIPMLATGDINIKQTAQTNPNFKIYKMLNIPNNIEIYKDPEHLTNLDEGFMNTNVSLMNVKAMEDLLEYTYDKKTKELYIAAIKMMKEILKNPKKYYKKIADKTACYIISNGVSLEDVTDQFIFNDLN